MQTSNDNIKVVLLDDIGNELEWTYFEKSEIDIEDALLLWSYKYNIDEHTLKVLHTFVLKKISEITDKTLYTPYLQLVTPLSLYLIQLLKNVTPPLLLDLVSIDANSFNPKNLILKWTKRFNINDFDQYNLLVALEKLAQKPIVIV